MTPPPTSFAFQKMPSSPNILAAQSMTTASSSVHAGLANHCVMRQESISLLSRNIIIKHTLKPGLAVLEDSKSPSIPSKVLAVGKYAKKDGCCQCVKPSTSSWTRERSGVRQKKPHTRNDDILIIIYDSCPIMSLLGRRVWSAARISWFFGS